MKRVWLLIPFLILSLSLVLPGTAYARDLMDDKVVFGGSFVLVEGDTLDGDLVVFGGSASLESGSLVRGDVVMFGGSIQVDGEVAGDMVSLGGSVRLGAEAVIQGDLVVPGGSVNRDEGARVEGEVITGSRTFFDIPFSGPVVVDQTPAGVRILTRAFWFLFRTFAFAALAVLVVMFLPRQTQTVAQAVVAQPVVTGGVGLLTLVVAPLVLIIMIITLILIPVSLLVVVVLGLAIVFGWIALGLEVGQRLARSLNQTWALPVEAGLGTLLLTFVVNSVGFIRCVGWVAPFLVVVLGLGGVLLTRFGIQPYLGGSATDQPAPPPIAAEAPLGQADEPLPPPSPPAESDEA